MSPYRRLPKPVACSRQQRMLRVLHLQEAIITDLMDKLNVLAKNITGGRIPIHGDRGRSSNTKETDWSAQVFLLAWWNDLPTAAPSQCVVLKVLLAFQSGFGGWAEQEGKTNAEAGGTCMVTAFLQFCLEHKVTMRWLAWVHLSNLYARAWM